MTIDINTLTNPGFQIKSLNLNRLPGLAPLRSCCEIDIAIDIGIGSYRLNHDFSR